MFFQGRKHLAWLLAITFLLTQVFMAGPVLAGPSDKSPVKSITAVSSSTSGTDRIAGADRYKTAAAVSQRGWKTSRYAVLARGDNFADALCAGPLAQRYGGPILLTSPNQLNSDTLKELQRLGVEHLFIAGGTGAVSQNVENALKTAGIDIIERISGTTRYETSVKIAEKLGQSSKAVLATGGDFPDALSISAISAKLQMPILLTAKDSLPGSVGNYLESKKVTQTYLVGGTGVISSGVEASVPGPVRLAGTDRYETNQVILNYFEKDLNFESIFVAIGGGPKGNEFADALTGAVLAAKSSSPLILTGQTLPAGTAGYLKERLVLSSKVKGLGGVKAVPSSVLKVIMAYKEQIPVARKYSTAGTHGPASGKETISGSVTISAAGVTLQNTIIEGDLLLASSIGDGDVTLKDVTVKGKTIINGGGPNSVIMYNFDGQTVVIDVPDNSNVRLVAQGSTNVTNVFMEGNGTLEESGLTGDGFITVEIPAGAEVTLNGNFNTVNIEAADANVTVAGGLITTLNITKTAERTMLNLAGDASVTNLNADAEANISGLGQITNANINADKVSIDQTPVNTTVAPGVSANVGGQQQGTGTSTVGGGDSTVSVSSITVTGQDNSTVVAQGSQLQMSSIITPANASYKTVTWSLELVDRAAGTAINQDGLLTTGEPGKVRVTATARDGSGIKGMKEITIAWKVNKTAPAPGFSTIAEAVSNAASGDTILVETGTYPENLTIDKSLTIKAKTGQDAQIIGSGSANSILSITADNVTVDGFTVNLDIEHNAGVYAINVQADDVTLSNLDLNQTITYQNSVLKHGAAICLMPGTDGFTFSDSTVDSAWNGIHMQRDPASTNVEISNVEFNYPGQYAVLLMSTEGAVIDDCTFNCQADTDDSYGLIATAADNVSITGNTFTGSSPAKMGILIQKYAGSSGSISISENNINGWAAGIVLESGLSLAQGAVISIDGNELAANTVHVDDAAGLLDLAVIMAGNTYDRRYLDQADSKIFGILQDVLSWGAAVNNQSSLTNQLRAVEAAKQAGNNSIYLGYIQTYNNGRDVHRHSTVSPYDQLQNRGLSAAQPKGLTTDDRGYVYIGNREGSGSYAAVINVHNPDLTAVSTFNASESEFGGIAAYRSGSNYYLYIAREASGQIHRYNVTDPQNISPDTSFGTNGVFQVSGGNKLRGIAVDTDGTIFVADRDNNKLFRVSSDLGTVTFVELTRPMDVTLFDGNAYITSYNGADSLIRVVKKTDLTVLEDISINTLDGANYTRGSSEGWSGIDISPDGRIWLCDQAYGSNQDRLLVSNPVQTQ